MNKEQLLEKMLANVRAEKHVTDGLQKKIYSEWSELFKSDVENCLSGLTEFRIKPRTRNICGFDVPAPEVDEPEDGAEYWYIDSYKDQGVSETYWNSDNYDIGALRNGIWLNEEDAIANAKALRGGNPYE